MKLLFIFIIHFTLSFPKPKNLIKSHPTKEMRFVKIGFCGVRIFNVILWCPHF